MPSRGLPAYPVIPAVGAPQPSSSSYQHPIGYQAPAASLDAQSASRARAVEEADARLARQLAEEDERATAAHRQRLEAATRARQREEEDARLARQLAAEDERAAAALRAQEEEAVRMRLREEEDERLARQLAEEDERAAAALRAQEEEAARVRLREEEDARLARQLAAEDEQAAAALHAREEEAARVRRMEEEDARLARQLAEEEQQQPQPYQAYPPPPPPVVVVPSQPRGPLGQILAPIENFVDGFREALGGNGRQQQQQQQQQRPARVQLFSDPSLCAGCGMPFGASYITAMEVRLRALAQAPPAMAGCMA